MADKQHTPNVVGAAEVSAQKSISRKGGRPKYEPSLQDRNDVRLFKADGWTDDRIAARLGVSRNTLLKHFPVELTHGADAVRADVLRNLMRASKKGSVSASNKLLGLSNLQPPPPPPTAAPAVAAPIEQLSKKAQAKLDAATAEKGTSWGEVLRH